MARHKCTEKSCNGPPTCKGHIDCGKGMIIVLNYNN
jgi:hypothetical protein